jgi:putative addiction module killer protein
MILRLDHGDCCTDDFGSFWKRCLQPSFELVTQIAVSTLSALFFILDLVCPIGHNLKRMQIKQRRVEYYTALTGKQPAREWVLSIKDMLKQAIIFKRIRQAGLGQLGNTRSLGSGVHELKINYGPGFRIYYGIHQDELILILAGGSKSTQQSDIKKAQAYWLVWKEDNS